MTTPRFHTQADGTAACAHRDLSVCPACQASAGPRLVEVYGVHYWTASEAEAAELRAELSAL